MAIVKLFPRETKVCKEILIDMFPDYISISEDDCYQTVFYVCHVFKVKEKDNWQFVNVYIDKDLYKENSKRFAKETLIYYTSEDKRTITIDGFQSVGDFILNNL